MCIQQWASTKTSATTRPRSTRIKVWWCQERELPRRVGSDNNNVYSLARYNYGSCGIGHPNDWEHVVVWGKDGNDMPS
ncbi:hypothetical protein CHU98_g4504 [Xylaria longipes]|nr:hypothetical protein CHU98_g4504 [Xylaria longipes]